MTGRPLFDAVLTPHRSLPPAGFRLLLAALAGVGLLAGLAFLALGAWPVLGFLGLEFALLAFCFRRNYRDGRRSERLRLTSDALTVERIDPAGAARTVCLPPWRLRVEIDATRDPPGPLTLAAHGRREIVGAFLAPDERVEVATALRRALAALRPG